tara:strand:- start:3429 stop:3851 length:423 start_codon:yes stop_codon:yes gene_type:complete
MYCIECGGKMPEKSKFCPNCGKKQILEEPSVKEQIAEKIIEKEIVRQVVEEHKKSLDYQFLRKAMGWYLAWVVIHLGVLLIFSRDVLGTGSSYMDKFVPFSKRSAIKYYDIREFLVYTIFPLAILVIWSMIRSQSENSEK